MATRWWGLGRGTAVAGALNVLAYIAAALAGLYEWGWIFWLIVSGGALATLTVIFLAARGVKTEKQTALLAGQEQRRMLQEMLVPIMEVFGEIAIATTAPARRSLQGHMKHVVIRAARSIGPPHTRACLLEVSGNAGARELACPAGMWAGRQETPRTTFREGTPRGDRLLRSMDKREPLFVPDLLAEPREYQPDTQTYKTFITAPVAPAITHPAFGMLAIDSPTKGDLAEHDIKIIEILGQLLGSALAIKR
ncbi:hypothetical protein ABZS71_14285 [Streptomyces sp. NPDC005393]|uniref:hypothetical protein n=1 Tax=Streptomyces sp. NPDC005393 TaxID=3157041 RepID=UPI0033AFB877